MSDKLQNKIKIHQKWGFGMAPPKEHTVVSRRKAVQLVLSALSGGTSSEPNSLADAISEVKGLFNRAKKMDQWDWFIVWEQLGLPEHKRLRRIIGDLVVLRKAVVNNDKISYENSRERLQNWGALTSLKYFLELEKPPIENDTGILYMLGHRKEKGQLKIGYTARDIVSRVKEINRATGIPTPFGVRHVWRVRNPRRVEREVHGLLADYRVRPDREFFDMEYIEAVQLITKYLEETQAISRERGIVKCVLAEKEYGFLVSDGKDFFFHATEVKGIFSEITEGDTVEFTRLQTSLGYAASDILRIM